MILSITRVTSPNRRQRWQFTTGPDSDDQLTFILSEYAVETKTASTNWSRQKLLYYKRRRSPEALMPLAEVPLLDEATRQLLYAQLTKQLRFYTQSNDGVQPL
jgi:hypothetical protein